MQSRYPKPLIQERIIDNNLYQQCLEEGFSQPVGRMIAGREIAKNTASIRRALMPKLTDIPSPDSLKDIDKAVDRLLLAKQRSEILLGAIDFDSDGCTSGAVLYRGLILLGFKQENISLMSAHRLIEGYGLNDKMVQRIIDLTPRPSLVVTADNGSSNAVSIALLDSYGIDVIVTDHHALLDGPPTSAVAVVNPIRTDCKFPDKSIAGVSVVFMVLVALRKRLIGLGQLESSVSIAPLIAFCGLGVQADCVHLGKSLSNRTMVRYALERIKQADTYPCWPALKQLSRNEDQLIDSEFLSFTIAPAINAAGRLDVSKPAGDLFLTSNRQEADHLVKRLGEFNEERKIIERKMAKEAKTIAIDENAAGQYGLMCFLPSGNPGVVGIVASRVMQAFGKPSMVLAPMVGNSDLITGSLRSTEGYRINEAILWMKTNYPNLIERGGGHDRAGGISIQKQNLETLALAFEASCREQIHDESTLRPLLETDGLIDPSLIHLDLFYEINALQPFGQGFPSPVFECEGALLSYKMVGSPAIHAQLNIKLGDDVFKGIWFFCKEDPADELSIKMNESYHWAFSLSENRFRGRSNLQLIIAACQRLNVSQGKADEFYKFG